MSRVKISTLFNVRNHFHECAETFGIVAETYVTRPPRAAERSLNALGAVYFPTLEVLYQTIPMMTLHAVWRCQSTHNTGKNVRWDCGVQFAVH